MLILELDLVLQTITLMKTIDYALKVYDEDPEAWKGIMTRAMQAKLDWDASADQYLKVFNSLIG